MNTLFQDQRLVLTLDAGGTSFRFSAMQGGRLITEPVRTESHANDLDRCLATLRDGFAEVLKRLPAAPVAISFAFPGPADYPAGIIGELPNFPSFRGGIALGPMIADAFNLPVFINNDGDLFAYGEALGGLMPQINEQLAAAGSPRRFRNLFGVTLGTGSGGGVVANGELLVGDNGSAAEVWITRNPLLPSSYIEESISIRAVRRVYAAEAGLALADAPDPRVIAEIARGQAPGNATAARTAYATMGEALGELICNAVPILDCLVVVGGGLAGAYPLFAPAAVAVCKREFRSMDGELRRRLIHTMFDLENATELHAFLRGQRREITVPGGTRTLSYDPMIRTGIGLSRLGTSEAIGLGAYAYALRQLDRR